MPSDPWHKPNLIVMKQLFIAVALVLTTVAAQAQPVFSKGDKKMDMTIGVGIVASDESMATFDQHFGMEWDLWEIAGKVTVGLGFTVNNAYCPGDEGAVAGEYDYYYN